MILGSALLFSLMGVGVKSSRGRISAETLLFYRFLFQVGILVPWFREFLGRDEPVQAKLKYHFIRGTLGVLGVLSWFQALQRLPIALAALLVATNTLWSAAFSRYFLKEVLSPRQLLYGGVACFGVALSLLPHHGGGSWQTDPLGIMYGLLGGMFSGAAYTLLRKMRARFPTKEIVFSFGVVGIFWTLPFLIVQPFLPSSGRDWFILISVGVLGSVAQLLLTAGFKYTPAFLGSVSSLQGVLINAVLGFLLLGEVPPIVFFLSLILALAGISGLLLSL